MEHNDIRLRLDLLRFIEFCAICCQVQDIISVDPCHKFTWCLDACIREKNVDVKRSRELQGFLDSIKVRNCIKIVFYNIVCIGKAI